ncbi:MAG: VIT1/CCC1 transporter family protein [Candidatus Pacebacteria bacterium]|nr:VIT1/CCC1 transporter family protein [Candidatus Paceibacterota bacterium]
MHKAGKYIGDLVYGANDGIITTFAIVAGVAGANLSPSVVIILGMSNVLADGFSMAASNYLARKSEKDYLTNIGESKDEVHDPIKNATATFVAFLIAGMIPLLPYMIGLKDNVFNYAILSTSIALFTVGSLRAKVTGMNWFKAGIEMLLVGALAAGVAYLIGDVLAKMLI